MEGEGQGAAQSAQENRRGAKKKRGDGGQQWTVRVEHGVVVGGAGCKRRALAPADNTDFAAAGERSDHSAAAKPGLKRLRLRVASPLRPHLLAVEGRKGTPAAAAPQTDGVAAAPVAELSG